MSGIKYEELKTNEEKSEYMYCLIEEILTVKGEMNELASRRNIGAHTNEYTTFDDIIDSNYNAETLGESLYIMVDAYKKMREIYRELMKIHIKMARKGIQPTKNENCEKYTFTYTFKS